MFRRRTVVGLAVASVAAPAVARIRWREPPYPPDRSPAFVRRMSLALVGELAANKTAAALVFRAGLRRADMPDEMAYTHGALWLRRDLAPRLAPGDEPADPANAYVLFGLFTGDGVHEPKSRSVLRVERPADFMRRSIADDVGVVIPTAALQARLATLVASPTYAAMRVPRYSALANPFQRKFQNCDVFLLYLVGAAAWGLSDPEAVRARLVAEHFEPTHIRAPRLLAQLAPLVDPRISMADQNGELKTASYESIARFMRRERLASDVYVFQPIGRRPADARGGPR